MTFMTQRWTLANILPVAFVVWVITTIWVLYVWLHLLPLLQLGLPAAARRPAEFKEGVVEGAISQTLALLLVLCFLRAVFTDPGSVPPDWQHSILESKAPSATSQGALTADTQLHEVK
eukprot:CAMPEP_0179345946 /NCGR_PEP_ID=MMETSP0797-20121207/72315_1 /TAXON_ID=47934 /ORGANISM="Dinophysis acuminata, Strain DAEP01" /LENGTH=117 /DNA_ID=CAMNT_0021060469 /DNA_START=112 /DNA_END=462 /DNA_ORIENTATION=-